MVEAEPLADRVPPPSETAGGNVEQLLLRQQSPKDRAQHSDDDWVIDPGVLVAREPSGLGGAYVPKGVVCAVREARVRELEVAAPGVQNFARVEHPGEAKQQPGSDPRPAPEAADRHHRPEHHGWEDGAVPPRLKVGPRTDQGPGRSERRAPVLELVRHGQNGLSGKVLRSPVSVERADEGPERQREQRP